MTKILKAFRLSESRCKLLKELSDKMNESQANVISEALGFYAWSNRARFNIETLGAESNGDEDKEDGE